MATTDLRRFYFYQRYLWTPGDFENLQNWIYGSMQSIFEGHLGGAVLSGLAATPGGNLALNLTKGIACGDSGEILVAPLDVVVNLPSPGSDTNYLVVMRPTSTDMTLIPEPTNPGNPVPLHSKRSFDLVTLTKTPTFEGDYPTKQAGDVVVIGVRLLSGATVIQQSDIDYGVVGRPRKQIERVKTVTESQAIDPTLDDIVEANFSSASGTLQLPAAINCPGLRVSIVKVDNSSNEVEIAASGSETISGQGSISLDSQWDSVTLYSNSLGWRQI